MRPVHYRLQALGRQQSFMRLRTCRLGLSRWLRQLLTTFYRASGLVVVAAFSFGPSMAEARENAEEVSSSGRRGRSHQSEGLLDEVWTLPEDPCPDEDDQSGRCGRGPETVEEAGAGPSPLTDLAPPAIAGVAALSALVMTRNGDGGSSPAAPAATAVPPSLPASSTSSPASPSSVPSPSPAGGAGMSLPASPQPAIDSSLPPAASVLPPVNTSLPPVASPLHAVLPAHASPTPTVDSPPQPVASLLRVTRAPDASLQPTVDSSRPLAASSLSVVPLSEASSPPSRDLLPQPVASPLRSSIPAADIAAHTDPQPGLDLHGQRLLLGGGNQNNTTVLRKGALSLAENTVFTNTGIVDDVVLAVDGGKLYNAAGADMRLASSGSSQFRGGSRIVNEGTLTLSRALSGSGVLLNRPDALMRLSGAGEVHSSRAGSFINQGDIQASGATADGRSRAIFVDGWSHGAGLTLNTGSMRASGGYGVMATGSRMQQEGRNVFVNRGDIDFSAEAGATRALHVKAHHGGHDLLNDTGGVITVRGDNAVAMQSDSDSQMVNRGTINLGDKGDSGRGMVAMVLGNAASGAIVNDTGGVISIRAKASYAFRVDGRAGTLINRGEVRLDCGDGSCGIFADNYSRARDSSGSAADTGFAFQPRIGEAMSATLAALASPPGDAQWREQIATEAAGRQPAGDRMSLSFSRRDLRGQQLLVDYQRQFAHADTLQNGTLLVASKATFSNRGALERVALDVTGTADNQSGGRIVLDAPARIRGQFSNQSGGDVRLHGEGTFHYRQGGSFANHGTIMATQAAPDPFGRAILDEGGTPDGLRLNTGTLSADGGYGVMKTRSAMAAGRNVFVNRGDIGFAAGNGADRALQVGTSHTGHDLLNDRDGVIAVSGDNAVAMYSDSDSFLVNRGTLRLGERGTRDTGMVAMALGRNATGTIVNDVGGVIDIRARESYAFRIEGDNGRLINRGIVRLDCGDGSCGVFRDAGTAARDAGGTAVDRERVNPARLQQALDEDRPRRAAAPLNGYVVGTLPDGSAGTLSGSHLDARGVTIDTGFTAGTAAREATFDKVLRGERIDGIDGIASRTAVWQAQAHRDSDGDVSVTLSKNDYRELVSDSALRPVAAALEHGYDGRALYRSLELDSAAEVTDAVRQLSGAGLDRALRPLQMLEPRFDRMADAARPDAAGFSFSLLGRGEPGSRLGEVSHDMALVGQRIGLGRDDRIDVRYGIASLKPQAGAGRNGPDGISQVFALDHARMLGRGVRLENRVRYLQHQLNTQRTLRYGSVDEQASASHRRDQFSGQTSLVQSLSVADGLTLEPSFGMRWRHQRDAALEERGAGDYGLSLSSQRQTALEGVLGLRVSYDGVHPGTGRGWRIDAALNARPLLYRQHGERMARLNGAPDARFALPSTNDDGRVAYDGRLGVRYQGQAGHFSLNAYIGREGAARDKGVSIDYQYAF